MPSDQSARELRDYLAVLRRRRWIVVAATLVAASTALLLSFIQTPVYQARARVLIQAGGSLFDSSFGQATDPNLLQNEVQVIQSQPVIELARQKLNGVTPPFSVVPVGLTSVIEVRAESTNAARATTISNAYAEAYVEYSRKQNVAGLLSAGEEIQAKINEVQKSIDDLSARLADIPPCAGNNPPPNCSQREPLQQDRDSLVSQLVPLKQRLNQFQVDASFNRGGPRLIRPAAVPTTPVRPRPIRNSVMGLAAGMLLGVALAFVVDHFDDTIKSKEDLERVARDLPVLGLIPMIPGWKNREETYLVSRVEPSSPAAEAYRTLRTSIHFLAIDRALRVIQVTSPNASEGKSTAVANLAVVLARAGERVVVVSCDLRRPRIHEFFGLANTKGFTSVLLGQEPLSSALQKVPGEERLLVLPSGPPPPNPSELLASQRTADLIGSLREVGDIILLDCPPALPVTDSAVLAARSDGLLLVGTVGSTTGKHFTRTVEILHQVGAPLIGAVLNGVTAEGAYGYTYQYYNGEPTTNGRGSAKRKKQTANP